MKCKTLTRPVTITVASIVFLIYGILELVSGILILSIFGLLAGSSLDAFLTFIVGLATIIVVIGLLDLAIGYGLLKLERWSGILGMLVCIFGITVESAAISILGLAQPLGYGTLNEVVLVHALSEGGIWLYILTFALIAISRKAFEHNE